MVKYVSMHARVARIRRKAAAHLCAHCSVQAEEWAYDHADPDEVTGTTSRGIVVAYSLDPAHYMPLCRACHSRFDVGHSENRTPCGVPTCETRVSAPFDFCSRHPAHPGPGAGGKPGQGLDRAITALVVERAGQASDICRRCKIEKPVTEFSRDQRRPKGYIPVCRPCTSAVSLEHYHRKRMTDVGMGQGHR